MKVIVGVEVGDNIKSSSCKNLVQILMTASVTALPQCSGSCSSAVEILVQLQATDCPQGGLRLISSASHSSVY